MTSDTLDLEAIRSRAEAARPGPWRKYNGNEGSVDYGPFWAVAEIAARLGMTRNAVDAAYRRAVRAGALTPDRRAAG